MPIYEDGNGRLVFAGTRVPIETLFDYVARGKTLEEFLKDFPDVSRQDAIAIVKATIARLTEPTTEPVEPIAKKSHEPNA